jgi:Spy/CpxP family protein refolding chaperone
LPARLDRLFAALLLLAGLLVGFAASTLAYRYGLLHARPRGIVERMDRELKLTPDQHEQIVAVMEDTRSKMADLRRDFSHRRRELFNQASDRIRAVLNPEQQQRFDKEFRFGPHEGGMRRPHD